MRLRIAIALVLFAAALPALATGEHPNKARGFDPEKAYAFDEVGAVNLFNGNLTVPITLGRTYQVSPLISYGFTLFYGGNNWSTEMRVVLEIGEDGKALTQCDLHRCWVTEVDKGWMYPTVGDNAGFGWRLHFGEVSRSDALPPSEFIYQAPDGSTHRFFRTLHAGHAPENAAMVAGVYYTRDGSYLRAQDLPGDELVIEFPDGVKHTFKRPQLGLPQKVHKIEDPFGNKVEIELNYTGAERPPEFANAVRVWRIEDSHHRVHWVAFRKGPDYHEKNENKVEPHEIIEAIQLQISDDTDGDKRHAQWDFHYEGGTPLADGTVPWRKVYWPTGMFRPLEVIPEKLPLNFLVEVDQPDGTKYEFDYAYDPPATFLWPEWWEHETPGGGVPDQTAIGILKEIVVPTGAAMRWDYVYIPFPNSSLASATHKNPPALTAGNAVYERRTYPSDAANEEHDSRRRYTWYTDPGATDSLDPSLRPLEKHVIVEDFDGNDVRLRKTQHFHNICATRECISGAVKGEYSLPFTRRDRDYNTETDRGAGRFLSSITYGPEDNWNRPLTLSYVGYEADIDLSRNLVGEFDYNRRVVSQRSADWIVGADGIGAVANCVNDKFENFDGLGHYRLATRTTTCQDGGLTRITTTFNNQAHPQAGGLPLTVDQWPWSTHQLPGLDKPWLTNAYSMQSVEEKSADGTRTATNKALFDFDEDNGLLLRKRVLALSDPNPIDVVTKYDYAGGHLTTESYFGGDVQPLSPGTLGSMSLANPELTLKYEYDIGVLTKASHHDPAAPETLYDTDLVVDSSGAVVTSKDPSGVISTFTYDEMSRLKTTSSGGRAFTEYDWQPAARRVTATAYTSDDRLTILTRAKYDYDHFGRLTTVWQRQHDEADSRQEHRYDALGRRISTTVMGRDSDLPKTSITYDTLGRTRIITAPDGTRSADFGYEGSRRKTRKQWVWNGSQDVLSETIEELDGFGRLIRITEPSGTGNTPVVTDYTYTVGDRLVEVSQPPQRRTFAYDGRGFLTSEFHPESGTASYTYDSRGHVLTKTTADLDFNLRFEYDLAERLRKVSGLDPANGSAWRPLKEFVYAGTNADGEWNKGKLIEAVRHNYPVHDQPLSLDVSRGEVTVTEKYKYADDAGRRTHRETIIDAPPNPPTVFNQSVKYTHLDQPEEITYPLCNGCNVPALGQGTLRMRYRSSRLDRIDGLIDTFDYAPNGMWTRRRHANGITDVQAPDPHGMSRPASISAERCGLIAEQPQDKEVTSGQPASFTVTTTRPDVTFQWYRGFRWDDSSPIAGATSATLDIASVTTTSVYWCRVTRADELCYEDTVTVTAAACIPPNITSPSGEDLIGFRRVPAGTPVPLSIVASGTSLTYKWFKQVGSAAPVEIPGSNGAQIVFTPDADGLYVISAAVGNSCGSVDRVVSRLEVVSGSDASKWPCLGSLSIGLPDLFTIVNPFEATTFEVGLNAVNPNPLPANVTPPSVTYSFKWYQDGVLVQHAPPHVESSSKYQLRFENQTYARVDATVLCSYADGTSTESPVQTTKGYGVRWEHCPIPEIFINPLDVVVPAGETVDLIADVPYPRGTYQWYEGESGNTASGVISTNKDLTVSVPGSYWLRVTTDCGTHADSPSVRVSSATCTPVKITDEPDDASTDAGAPVTLTVRATSKPAPNHILWLENENLGEGEKSIATSRDKASIEVRPLRTTDYYADIGNACTFTRTRIARVHVTSCSDINIIQQPGDKSVLAGVPVDLTVHATSVDQLRYLWYRGESGDTSKPPIGSDPTLHLATPASGKYWVRMYFDQPAGAPPKCAVDSRTVTVKVCAKPTVINPLGNYINVYPRYRRVLHVGIEGEDIKYQWYEGRKNDTSRPMASKSSAAAVWPDSTSYYWVHVTNANCDPALNDMDLRLESMVSVCPDFSGPPVASKTLVNYDETVTLEINGIDRAQSLQWYMVMPAGTTPQPIGTTDIVTTPKITSKATFYVVAKSGECEVKSEEITVDLCSGLSVSWAHSNKTSVEREEQTTLTAYTGGNVPVSWQWYIGTTKGDVANSQLVFSSSNVMTIRLTESTSYWIRATKTDTGCYVDSEVLTVNVCVPKITAQPQSVMINSGATATLTVAADLPNLTYAWYRGQPGDTTNKVGNDATFTTPILTAETTYWARVTGCVSRDSAAATVSICKEPAITQHPSDATLASGGTTLSVTATGTELAYQWYQGQSGDTSAPIAGQTAASLTINPAVTTNYWVRVSGRCGAAKNSSTAKFSRPPSITASPAGAAVTKGTVKTLSVTASGTELTYQWYQRGTTSTALTGQTNATFTTPAINVDVTYFVRVHSGNAYGDSADAVLTVCQPRTISATAYGTGISGRSVTLQVDGATTGETYEWYTGSTSLGTGTTKTVSPLVTTDYWVRTKRTGCDADSPAYTVRICIPDITTHPQSVEVAPNATKTLSVTATGTAPLSYQWYRGQSGDQSSPVSGATSASYTPPANTPTTTYWVRVSSPSAGCSTHWANSNAATMTLCQAPSISVQPASSIRPASSPATLEVTASGTNLSYQWFEGAPGDVSKPVSNGTDRIAYVQPPVTTNYWVRITGNCGTVNSTGAKVSVRATIQSHPAGGLVTKGETRQMSVTANGTELSYRWYQRSGGTATLISGATTSSYTTPQLLADATYFCRVTSGQADVDSNDAVFTVCQPRTIGMVGYGTQRSGADVTLQINNATAGETYEWYTGNTGNTTNRIGTGSSILVRPLATTSYWARTKRTGCDADSPAFTVTICYPNITTQPQGAGTVSGTSVRLTVAATGTGTLTYQWYRGASGDMSSPVSGATAAIYDTDPNAPTTSYWVRVSAPESGCPSYSANSAEALVTVCQKPKIQTQPESYNMVKNSQRTLTVVATGDNLHYQWYEGVRGDTSRPVGADQNTFDIWGLTTRQFWVRVSNSCGYEDSVTTTQSVYPAITQQPLNPCGSSMTMYVKATGADTYNWYRRFNYVTELIGTGPTVTTAPPGVPVEYWAEAVSGNAVTRSDVIYVTTIKAAPTLNYFGAAQYYTNQWTLETSVAQADRTLVKYKFYQGAQGDTSNLIVDSTQSYKTITPPYRPIKYWVRVYYTTGGCFVDRELTIP